MPVLYAKLTDEFVRSASQGGCTDEVMLDVQKEVSNNPTAGVRLISLYDDKSILPGSGWYQRNHSYELASGVLNFETLNLHISFNVIGYLVGFRIVRPGLANFVSHDQRAQLREVGLQIMGRAFYEEDN